MQHLLNNILTYLHPVTVKSGDFLPEEQKTISRFCPELAQLTQFAQNMAFHEDPPISSQYSKHFLSVNFPNKKCTYDSYFLRAY
jgi:hypothetical protein